MVLYSDGLVMCLCRLVTGSPQQLE